MSTQQPQPVPSAAPAPQPAAKPAGGQPARFDINAVKAKLAARGANGVRIFAKNEIGGALRKNVVGQDSACDLVDQTYSIGAARENSQKPICTMFLGGPPGTGKSFIVENLHKFITGESDLRSMLYVDCGKLKNAETGMTYLFGSPKGYVGAEDGGLISRGLQNRANSIILFDEMEKADRRIQESLLVALNSGFVEDMYTRQKVSAVKSAWFFTSNKNQTSLSPILQPVADPWERSKIIKNNYINSDFLSPEFADRIDAFLWLDKLSDDNLLIMIGGVVDASIKEFDQRISLAENGISDDVVVYLYDQLQILAGGTRELKRVVARTVQADLLDAKRAGQSITKVRIALDNGIIRAQPAT